MSKDNTEKKGSAVINDPVVPTSSAPEAPAPETNIPVNIVKGPEMVMISKEALEELKSQMIALNKKIDATGDRSRIADFNLKQNKKVTPVCRISFFRDANGDRLIMGWPNMISNSAKYGKNLEQVDQRSVLFLRDLTKDEKGELKYPGGIVSLEVQYTSFSQNKFQEEVEIISISSLNDGRRIFKVLREDGEEIDMDERFVN